MWWPQSHPQPDGKEYHLQSWEMLFSLGGLALQIPIYFLFAFSSQQRKKKALVYCKSERKEMLSNRSQRNTNKQTNLVHGHLARQQ